MATSTKYYVLLAGLLLMLGCTKELPELEPNPWDQDSDLEFVFVDSTVYDPGLHAFWMHFHVDSAAIPAGHSLFWMRVYRDGVYRNLQFFKATNAQIIEANVVSGRRYSYMLDFAERDGDTTRMFGPVEYLVP